MEFRESRNGLLFEEGLVRLMKSVPMWIKLEDTIIYLGDEQAIDNAQIITAFSASACGDSIPNPFFEAAIRPTARTNSTAQSRSAPPRALETSVRARGRSRGHPEKPIFSCQRTERVLSLFLIAQGQPMSDSVSAAAASRSRPAAAPKAARRNMARREIPLLHGGSIADVAALEGEMRRRARLQESFGRRLPEPPAAILALLACDGAMAKASLEAIERVGEIARGLDRTRRFAAGMETGWSIRSSPAAKSASQILRTARPMLVF